MRPATAWLYRTGWAARAHPLRKLEVSATVTFEVGQGGPRVASSALTVRGEVPGLDADAFREAAEAAKDACPISQALQGNVALSVEATLA